MSVVCDHEGYIDSIKICLEKGKNGKLKLAKCGKKIEWQCMSKRMFLKGWRVQEDDIDVFDWKKRDEVGLSDFSSLD